MYAYSASERFAGVRRSILRRGERAFSSVFRLFDRIEACDHCRSDHVSLDASPNAE